MHFEPHLQWLILDKAKFHSKDHFHSLHQHKSAFLVADLQIHNWLMNNFWYQLLNVSVGQGVGFAQPTA
tara:strand:+ start:133 stop:339 length:207 start_codon:yes stop_codon:yes gene_type:complete